MSRLRPFRARVGVAGAASLAALSLLVTSLTPLAMRASAADESAQSPDVASSQEAPTASSDTEVAAAPAAEAGVEAPAAEAGAEAPAAEAAPEDQPRTRRARAVADDQATLALNVVNDEPTLRTHDDQITTINFSCSSVTTPCKGAEIELTLPGPSRRPASSSSSRATRSFPSPVMLSRRARTSPRTRPTARACSAMSSR